MSGHAVSQFVNCDAAWPDTNSTPLYDKPRPHTGSDLVCKCAFHCQNGFNPRPHTGSDEVIMMPMVDKVVSIHAPTRGATSYHELKLYQV